MQAEDTEEGGVVFEVLMSMRKVEACRSSGGRMDWYVEGSKKFAE